jgi:hypothetical protein
MLKAAVRLRKARTDLATQSPIASRAAFGGWGKRHTEWKGVK